MFLLAMQSGSIRSQNLQAPVALGCCKAIFKTLRVSEAESPSEWLVCAVFESHSLQIGTFHAFPFYRLHLARCEEMVQRAHNHTAVDTGARKLS